MYTCIPSLSGPPLPTFPIPPPPKVITEHRAELPVSSQQLPTRLQALAQMLSSPWASPDSVRSVPSFLIAFYLGMYNKQYSRFALDLIICISCHLLHCKCLAIVTTVMDWMRPPQNSCWSPHSQGGAFGRSIRFRWIHKGWGPHDEISVFSFNFIYLFFLMFGSVGLCCYVWACSSFGEWGLLLFEHGLSSCGTWLSCLVVSSWIRMEPVSPASQESS